eukprot:scaffold1729_cov173-Ochromonas_danica.AAC.2
MSSLSSLLPTLDTTATTTGGAIGREGSIDMITTTTTTTTAAIATTNWKAGLLAALYLFQVTPKVMWGLVGWTNFTTLIPISYTNDSTSSNEEKGKKEDNSNMMVMNIVNKEDLGGKWKSFLIVHSLLENMSGSALTSKLCYIHFISDMTMSSLSSLLSTLDTTATTTEGATGREGTGHYRS